MSMTANLNNEEMTCWCPACGEITDIYEDDLVGILPDGEKEYWVCCPECGQSFYASKSY